MTTSDTNNDVMETCLYENEKLVYFDQQQIMRIQNLNLFLQILTDIPIFKNMIDRKLYLKSFYRNV